MNIDYLMHPIALRRDLHKRFEAFFEKYMPPGAVVYDIGCGQKPFAAFLKGKASNHIGVDLADGFYKPDYVDLIGTAYEVPAANGVADAVILSEVIEHLETPLVAIREASRLLRPEGILFLSFPFLYPQHAPPRDFMRYTEYYLQQELVGADFEIVEYQRIGGFWYMLGQFSSIYLRSFDIGIVRRLAVVKILISCVSLVCFVIHRLEGYFLRLLGKDVSKVRAAWALNYQVVLRKKK